MSGDLHIYWYNPGDNSIIDMGATQKNGYLVFETSHFSFYAIAKLSTAPTNTSFGTSSTPTSTPSNPDTGGTMFQWLRLL